MSITMGGLFRLMERISQGLPARGKLDDKVRFEEKINFVLSSESGEVNKGQ